MKEYWDKRFSEEKKIWNEEPSKTALYALKLFKNYDIKKVLVPGAGYGRNSKIFSNKGYNVISIEISDIAYEIAKTYDPKTKSFCGSVLDMPYNDDIYDAIYCFNTLHLFLRNNRVLFLKKCYNQLKTNGLIFFIVFSEKEKTLGKGKEIEENTFESKPGRFVYYFSEEDLIEHFKDFLIMETGIMEDQENHGEIGPHIHKLRYIFGHKRGKR